LCIVRRKAAGNWFQNLIENRLGFESLHVLNIPEKQTLENPSLVTRHRWSWRGHRPLHGVGFWRDDPTLDRGETALGRNGQSR
jgi:hypothetical protein